jgi:GTP-binding protein Era
VGKSTLANALSGRHVSAVSPRPQTTRRRVMAVVDDPGGAWQAVLVDLPGFQRPADRLTSRMQQTVDRSLEDTDGALLVLNGAEPIGGGDRFIAARLAAVRVPALIVVNQVDRVGAEVAQTLPAAAGLLPGYRALHPVSALTGEGLLALRDDLPGLLPAGPALFPPGAATDQSDEEMAAELIREAALQRVRQEIPHALAVQVEEIAPAREGRVVRAALLVEHDSQKAIVIGHGGRVIREVGRSARQTLSLLWGEPVHTDLTVKVRKRWRRDDAMLDRLGL